MDVQKRSIFRLNVIAIKLTFISVTKVILVGFLHCGIVSRFIYY